MRYAPALTALTLAWAAPVAAQAPAATPSLAFVFDAGAARVDGELVRRAVASELHRSVVRITDRAADAAPATLTLAFAGTDRWVLEVTRGEHRLRQSVRLHASSPVALARYAVLLVRASEPSDEWVTVVDDDAIIDPFGGATRAPQRIPMIDEIVDPFSPPSPPRRYECVVDPWAR